MMIIKKCNFFLRAIVFIAMFALIAPGCKEDNKSEERAGIPDEVQEKIDKEKKDRELIPLEGHITFFVGRVEIIDNKSKVRKASIKSTVRKGYRLKTYDNSMAHIQLGSKSVVKVLSNTVLIFNILLKDHKTRITLKSGSVYSRIIKRLAKDENFKIATPNAVAAVRGTEFLTEYSKKKSNFFVKKGEIALYKTKKKSKKRVALKGPDALVKMGRFAVVEKRKKIKVKKLSEIKKLEIEKIAYGVEVIPKVKEKTVKAINKFNTKFIKKEKEFEKKIERKIQNIKNKSNPKVILVLKDGSKLKGFIIEQDEKMIKLDDGKDIMLIPKEDIVRREFSK